ncbi:unnamed protein product [Thlaspi arvense]|uniref:Plastocyanin-like domain-containing protein n=1 Tax=Thlaspi arvense TaxID=13288 RepID=A0AAU9SFL4_THLAR|nr:unnamed protein product [Thlaspi arvense]
MRIFLRHCWTQSHGGWNGWELSQALYYKIFGDIPGQTMNVLLATNQNPSHYYIAGNIENEEPTAAVLEYIGKYTPPSSPVFPSSLPVFRDIRAANAFWARLRSLASKEHSVSVPKHVDHPMFIVVSEKIIACPNRSCDSDNGNRISSSMNNITFQNPIANILLAYYRNLNEKEKGNWVGLKRDGHNEGLVVEGVMTDRIATNEENKLVEELVRGEKEKHHKTDIWQHMNGEASGMMGKRELFVHRESVRVVERHNKKLGNIWWPMAWLSSPRDFLCFKELSFFVWINNTNISGVYTPDFPDFPEVFYDFTDPNLSNNYTVPSIATKVKMINFNETVEIVFQGTDTVGGAQDHPVHMHGYSFYVVGFGLGDFNNETDPKSYNLVDPPELNTIRVPKNGWVTVRFTANNPETIICQNNSENSPNENHMKKRGWKGVWMLHCHLTKHLTWGMKTVLIVLNGDTPETSILDPPPSMPSCNFSFVNYIQKFKHSDVVHPVEIIGM